MDQKNHELFVVMMRRVWLDNALDVACQNLYPLLKEMTTDSENIQENLKILCKEPSYRQTLRVEWDKKELALERLADALESARRQIQLESLIIRESDQVDSKEVFE